MTARRQRSEEAMSASKKSNGTGIRYAADFGGNHIDRIRNKPTQGFFLDIAFKKCTRCGNRKPKKGGTRPTEQGWKCAECKAATPPTEAA